MNAPAKFHPWRIGGLEQVNGMRWVAFVENGTEADPGFQRAEVYGDDRDEAEALGELVAHVPELLSIARRIAREFPEGYDLSSFTRTQRDALVAARRVAWCLDRVLGEVTP